MTWIFLRKDGSKMRKCIAVLLIVISCAPIAAKNKAAEKRSGQKYIRIGHYQCVPIQGDFKADLKTVIRGLEQAKEANLDIVSFPESFLGGYFSEEEDARENAFSIDSPQMKELLEKTSRFESMFMVGFNEIRGDKIYNTVALIEKGRLIGTYSKAFPCMAYFSPGREFPVFEKKGLKFGIIICADGGHIEPARILALKGATIIFAPHYNYVNNPLMHNQMVRSDHVARAVENGVYFVRGNTVTSERSLKGLNYYGYGYGDSYVLNPHGVVVAAAGFYDEYLMVYNLDPTRKYRTSPDRSRGSAKALIDIYKKALDEAK